MCVTCTIPTSASKAAVKALETDQSRRKSDKYFPSDEELLREEWDAGQAFQNKLSSDLHAQGPLLQLHWPGASSTRHRPCCRAGHIFPHHSRFVIGAPVEEEDFAASAYRSRLEVDGMSSKRRSFPTKHPAGQIRSVGSGQSWHADWHLAIHRAFAVTIDGRSTAHALDHGG